jgi:hypothetical protein
MLDQTVFKSRDELCAEKPDQRRYARPSPHQPSKMIFCPVAEGGRP